MKIPCSQLRLINFRSSSSSSPVQLLFLLCSLATLVVGVMSAHHIPQETQIRPAPRQDPAQRNPFLEWLAGLIGTTSTTASPPLDPPKNCPACKCGRTNQATRIVGGTETRVNQYPWMAMLQYGGTFYCGGSLITDRHVLTAAHCVHGFNPMKISVVLLDHDRSSTTEAETITNKVKRVIKHNGYNSNTYNSDIAVLRLESPITFNEKLRPVCLPSAKKPFTGYDMRRARSTEGIQRIDTSFLTWLETQSGIPRPVARVEPSVKDDQSEPIDNDMLDWLEIATGIARPESQSTEPMEDISQSGRQDSAFLEWLEIVTGIMRPSPPLKPAENCTECKCGRTNQIKRIVGGMETRVIQYPWMAILKYRNSFYCGGSLITDRHLMTAAHCVHGFNPRQISATLLDHDRSTDSESEVIDVGVERIYKHPGYSPLNYDNDIAVLRLNKVLPMNDRLRPVCQPNTGELYAGENGIVTGWGTTSQGGQVSSTLQEVTVPIMSNEECRKSAYGENRITDNMLCAGLPEGGKDSCQGDSGGPLHVINKEMEAENIHQIAGVVSWGEGCAKPDYPGVYSRVNRYEEFIKKNTIDGCYCSL